MLNFNFLLISSEKVVLNPFGANKTNLSYHFSFLLKKKIMFPKNTLDIKIKNKILFDIDFFSSLQGSENSVFIIYLIRVYQLFFFKYFFVIVNFLSIFRQSKKRLCNGKGYSSTLKNTKNRAKRTTILYRSLAKAI